MTTDAITGDELMRAAVHVFRRRSAAARDRAELTMHSFEKNGVRVEAITAEGVMHLRNAQVWDALAREFAQELGDQSIQQHEAAE